MSKTPEQGLKRSSHEVVDERQTFSVVAGSERVLEGEVSERLSFTFPNENVKPLVAALLEYDIKNPVTVHSVTGKSRFFIAQGKEGQRISYARGRTQTTQFDRVRSQLALMGNTPASNTEFLRYLLSLKGKVERTKDSDEELVAHFVPEKGKGKKKKSLGTPKVYVSMVPLEEYVPLLTEDDKKRMKLASDTAAQAYLSDKWYLTGTWDDKKKRWQIAPVNEEYLQFLEGVNQRVVFVGKKKG